MMESRFFPSLFCPASLDFSASLGGVTRITPKLSPVVATLLDHNLLLSLLDEGMNHVEH
jgi:hypothetical protein